MHIDESEYTTVYGKKHRRILLRESYRENGKVKKKTIANLYGQPQSVIDALKLALKMHKDLQSLQNLCNGTSRTKYKFGSLYIVLQVAIKSGFFKTIGKTRNALLVFWLIYSRLIRQGSRLSSYRLSDSYPVEELLGLNDLKLHELYSALQWAYENQKDIEAKMFKFENKKFKTIFLYDLSSSYFQGTENELSAYGYNRDKIRGKKQINYGLLTDEDGDPVSIEAFKGNTSDNKTVKRQLEKLKQQFGCERVVFVGDKGMIKSGEITDIQNSGFQYITTITKEQIRTLIDKGTIQMSFFDENIFEIYDKNKSIRYILRKNPHRAVDMLINRKNKLRVIRNSIIEKNPYLNEHKRAKPETHGKYIQSKIDKLNIHSWLKITIDEKNRKIGLIIDRAELLKSSELDGCYVIKTDLPAEYADKEVIHARYKDLAKVEKAFRVHKTEHLDIRPIYLRKEVRTRGHLFITMLAYKIQRCLEQNWKEFNTPVKEILTETDVVTVTEIDLVSEKLNIIIEPDEKIKKYYEKLKIEVPKILPKLNVVTN